MYAKATTVFHEAMKQNDTIIPMRSVRVLYSLMMLLWYNGTKSLPLFNHSIYTC